MIKGEESNETINAVTNRESCEAPAAFRFPFLSDGSAGFGGPARENWHHYSHKLLDLSLERVGIALARQTLVLFSRGKRFGDLAERR